MLQDPIAAADAIDAPFRDGVANAAGEAAPRLSRERSTRTEGLRRAVASRSLPGETRSARAAPPHDDASVKGHRNQRRERSSRLSRSGAFRRP
jgi:hypothetical protein